MTAGTFEMVVVPTAQAVDGLNAPRASEGTQSNTEIIAYGTSQDTEEH